MATHAKRTAQVIGGAIEDPYILNRVLFFLDPFDLFTAARVSQWMRYRRARAQDLITRELAAQFAHSRMGSANKGARATARKINATPFMQNMGVVWLMLLMKDAQSAARIEFLRWAIMKMPCLHDPWSNNFIHAIYYSFQSNDQSSIMRITPLIERSPTLFLHALDGACANPCATVDDIRQVIALARRLNCAIPCEQWDRGMSSALKCKAARSIGDSVPTSAHNDDIITFLFERSSEAQADHLAIAGPHSWFRLAVSTASSLGNYDFIKRVAANNRQLYGDSDIHWASVLMYACERDTPDNEQTARLAIANGARDDDCEGLSNACKCGSVALIQLCMSVGAIPHEELVSRTYTCPRIGDTPGAFEYFARVRPKLVDWAQILLGSCAYAAFDAAPDDKIRADRLILRALAHNVAACGDQVVARFIELRMKQGPISYFNRWCANICEGYLSSDDQCSSDFAQVLPFCEMYNHHRNSSIVYDVEIMARVCGFIDASDLFSVACICADMRGGQQFGTNVGFFVSDLHDFRREMQSPQVALHWGQSLPSFAPRQQSTREMSIETRAIIAISQYPYAMPWFFAKIDIMHNPRIDWQRVRDAFRSHASDQIIRAAAAHGVHIGRAVLCTEPLEESQFETGDGESQFSPDVVLQRV